MEDKTIEQLQEENAALKAENESLEEINAALQSEIENFKAQPAPAPAKTKSLISDETFEHNGTQYGFALPGINHKGEVITADHVLSSEDLQAELVKMQSGFLKVV